MQGAKSNTLYYLVFFYFLFSIFIFFLDSRGALEFLHRGAQVLTIPVRSWLYDSRVTLLSPLSVFSSGEQNKQRISELEGRVASLSAQLGREQALEEENAKMRRLLGTNLPPNWQFAPGRVVSTSSDIMAMTSDYTPSVGVSVITSEENGILIGRVEKAVGKEVLVSLPTHISSKIPVIVRGQDGNRRASGIVVGQGRTARLEQVLASESLEKGDLVLTSGDANLPPELLIGYVDKVNRSQASPWQEAGVKSAIDPSGLDYVFFVTKY